MKYDFTSKELWFTRCALAKMLGVSRQSLLYHIRRLIKYEFIDERRFSYERMVRDEGGRLVVRNLPVVDLATADIVFKSFDDVRSEILARRSSELLLQERLANPKKKNRDRIIIDF